jgi:hypothetical protein
MPSVTWSAVELQEKPDLPGRPRSHEVSIFPRCLCPALVSSLCNGNWQDSRACLISQLHRPGQARTENPLLLPGGRGVVAAAGRGRRETGRGWTRGLCRLLI